MTATVTEIGTTGQAAEVQPPAAPAMERVKVTVTGVRTSGDIVQDLELDQPQGTPTSQTIAYTWSRVAGLGAMVFDELGTTKAKFYPLGSFEHVFVEVSPAVGVTLP